MRLKESPLYLIALTILLCSGIVNIAIGCIHIYDENSIGYLIFLAGTIFIGLWMLTIHDRLRELESNQTEIIPKETWKHTTTRFHK